MKGTFELLEYVLFAHRDERVGNSEEEIVEKEVEYVLGVSLVSFDSESVKKMLFSKT